MDQDIKMLNAREEFLISLYKYIGEFYRYGGKELGSGLDCSGLLFQILTKDLKVGPSYVLSAQGYYDYFLKENCATVLPGHGVDLGDICFFGKDSKSIHHISMAVNSTLHVEAAFGDRSIISEFTAKMRSARVLVGPIARLPDLFTIIRVNQIRAVLEPIKP